jgi:hypothetical protein
LPSHHTDCGIAATITIIIIIIITGHHNLWYWEKERVC